jgi:antitoxin VapB
MATARVFRSGNSQAVRLPKEFRFNSTEVEIFRRGDEIVLREKAKGLGRAFEILADLPADLLPEGREDAPAAGSRRPLNLNPGVAPRRHGGHGGETKS